MTVNVNTKISDKVIDRAAMIRLYERRINKKVSVVIDGHEVRVDKLIKDANLSTAGFNRLRDVIDKEIQGTFKEIKNVSERSLVDLVTDQVSFAYQNLETALSKVWRTQRPQRRVAEELVLNRPIYNDKTLSVGWSSIGLQERKRLEAVIRKGIADGKTPKEIALAVRKGNVHNITRNQSQALVTTAITSVHAQADHEVYKANEKVLQGWQYIAVLDSRTTSLCAHRDGQIYPIGDIEHLPPSHYNCRSTTTPVVKSYDDLAKLEGIAYVRKRNLSKLSKKDIEFYDGQTPLKESYHEWLLRQTPEIQLKHLGDYRKMELFQKGQLHVDKFINDQGNSVGIRELRLLTDGGYTLPGDTKRFAIAKSKLDSMHLGASTPDDFLSDKTRQKVLEDYYVLQANELDGYLSLTNYRGTLISSKKAVRRSVLNMPPREDQLKFNPLTGRYDDARLFQPNYGVFENNMRLVQESSELLPRDKEFISSVINNLSERLGFNERAVIADNLRIVFGRYRSNGEVWGNLKAVLQGQIKFDVMNVSDAIETQLRKDVNVLKRLMQTEYHDSILGPLQLQDLHDNFVSNIIAKNKWEDTVAPKIAEELRTAFDLDIPVKIKMRLSDRDLQEFYLKFAHRLSLADLPDKDQFAVSLGRDLYNMANWNGNRRAWYNLGDKILNSKNAKKFFELETFGVQKRRMKSRLSGQYFGPYYDSLGFNIRITDARIQEYALLTRKVELGLRVGVTTKKNRLIFREGYKTYFVDRGLLGHYDTRIPITSTSSFSDFPVEFIDKNMVDALNWAANAQYKVDPDFYDFIHKLLYFEDDRGRAKYFNELNEYRKYIASRGDSYERFKAMEWLRKGDLSFSNHPFIDHRARVYDRGLIGPQSGESFRPFLNTAHERFLGVDGYDNIKDQIGAFLGGLSDYFEGHYNSLSFTGRQKIADKWHKDIVEIGQHMLRAKPNNIRAVLENPVLKAVDGEEQGKFLRFAIEMAKIDNYLGGNYSKKSLARLAEYRTAFALEQDASSSGAQIIALTTRNKQLAELSNVIPTYQKRRLYDEIAASTFRDPRFQEMNLKLGLTEKDLRKAAKAQNMVTFYGAGERTGILNVEGKLAKVLGKDKDVLVVKASDRDKVLNEISARIARYEKFDQELSDELRALRENVKDVFNKGLDPGDDILEQLYFLEPKTKELVENLSHAYTKVITPSDFRDIAKIMSEYLQEQVPILKDFTRYFGRLAEDFLSNAKPSKADFDWSSVAKIRLLKHRNKGYSIPPEWCQLLGTKPGEPLSEKLLRRLPFWKPNGTLHELIYGAEVPDDRRIAGSIFKIELIKGKPIINIKVPSTKGGKKAVKNNLPKSWTNVPWVNFDGKVIEQNFTQSFEERLVYKDKYGNWITNILQIPQKTEATWWEQLSNKAGQINDIADATKARTAFAVNGNHSNDAVIVKRFHLWGKSKNIPTSSIHDAFFANAADMLEARKALRSIYAEVLQKNVIRQILDEMLARGLPKKLYDKYLEEAILKGLIPVPGKSIVGGKVLTIKDILSVDDILKKIPEGFLDDYGWYGVG